MAHLHYSKKSQDEYSRIHFRIWYEDNIHYAAVIHQVDYSKQEMINSEDDLRIHKKNKNIVLPLDCIYDASLNIDSSQRYPIDNEASTDLVENNFFGRPLCESLEQTQN
eukprot:scaffold28319_cov65-Cyclotella_meneghiniana.AAC.4